MDYLTLRRPPSYISKAYHWLFYSYFVAVCMSPTKNPVAAREMRGARAVEHSTRQRKQICKKSKNICYHTWLRIGVDDWSGGAMLLHVCGKDKPDWVFCAQF